MKKIFFSQIAMLCCMVICFISCKATSSLEPIRNELSAIAQQTDAEVGIAVIGSNGDTLTVNNDVHYPMMSVFKFHQALAVADYLRQNDLPLDTTLHITRADQPEGTWSPLRDNRKEAEFDISIADLLVYTLQQSDNNACDILFKLRSPAETDQYVRSLGIEDFNISYNEKDMSANHQLSYDNWTTPYAAASLLRKFIESDIIAEPYFSFIKETMSNCETGLMRLPAPLKDTGATIAHKTGSGYTENGRISGTNDLGYITLPNGKSYYIAVFIKDSAHSQEDTEKIIANISEIVYNHFNK